MILDVRLDPHEDSAGASRAQQLLSVKADDLSVDLETLVNGEDNLRLKLAVMDCIVQQSWLGAGEPTELLRRTLGRSPVSRTVTGLCARTTGELTFRYAHRRSGRVPSSRSTLRARPSRRRA